HAADVHGIGVQPQRRNPFAAVCRRTRPHLNEPVATAGRQQRTVRREVEAVDRVVQPGKLRQQTAGAEVEQPYIAIWRLVAEARAEEAASCNRLAVRRNRERIDPALAAGAYLATDGADGEARPPVPDADGLVLRSGEQCFAVGCDGEIAH